MVRVMEELFKRYVIVCEYLQIDPCAVLDIDFVKERAEHVLSQWNDADDPASFEILCNEVRWFVKDYEKLAGKGLMKRDFAYRCSLFVKKKYLKIHPGTVNKKYMKRELRHINYDTYLETIGKPR